VRQPVEVEVWVEVLHEVGDKEGETLTDTLPERVAAEETVKFAETE